MFIKNTTPYVGKIKFTFEKNPYYTSSGPYSVLNKVCWNLGFTKLVSRMYPEKMENGYHKIDPIKIKLITLNTKGQIGIHEWWECKSIKTGKTQKKYSQPDESIWEIINHFELPESFVSSNNDYIGDVQDAWWYYQNNLEVYEPYPHGVAKQIGEDGETIGYYGYTHRGGSAFKKGDRLFDENYIPKEEDYPEWQWFGWKNQWEDDYKNGDDLNKKWLDSDGIAGHIPFNLRGNKIIETWDDAITASINLSKYLS